MALLGRMNKWVTLANKQAEPSEDFTALDPEGCWAALSPQLSVGDTSRSIQHVVEMRWHPDVSLDTRIVYEPGDGRRLALYVRAVQNLDMDDDMLRLLCEEITP